MKLKLLIPIYLLLFSFTMNGQTATWEKSKKEAVYSNCLNNLRMNPMPEKKKKDICYCYIEAVQEKYTSLQFDNLLDEEIKRFRENSHCWPDEEMADNRYPGRVSDGKDPITRIGVVMPNVSTGELVGIWKFPHSWIYLNENGTYLINFVDSNQKNATGTWTVEEDKRSLELKGMDIMVLSHFEGHKFTYQTKGGQMGSALKVVKTLENMVSGDLLGAWQDENSMIYFYENKECRTEMNGENLSLKWRLDKGAKQIKFSQGFPTMNLIDFDGLSFRYVQNGETYRYVKKLF